MLTTVNHHLQSPSVLDHSEAVDPMPAVQFCRIEPCLRLSLYTCLCLIPSWCHLPGNQRNWWAAGHSEGVEPI